MNNKFKFFTNFTALSLACILLLVACSSHNEPEQSRKESQPLLKDLKAEQIDSLITSYKGEKALLVNVWATWCGPCVEEFPHIVELQKKYADRLHVLFISADFKEDRDRALKFLQNHNVNWTTYFKIGKDQKFINELSGEWSGALPFTKMIAKNGEVVSSWENSADFDTFENEIQRTLNY